MDIRSTTRYKVTFCLVLAALIAPPAAAQIPVGARPLGMGGAFTALADDVNGAFWNPAGVTELHKFTVNLFNVDVRLQGQEKVFDLFDSIPFDTQSLIDWVTEFGSENTSIASAGLLGVAGHGWAFSVLPFGGGLLSPNNGSGFQYVTRPDGKQVPVAGSVGKLTGTYGYYYMGTYATKTDSKTSIGTNLKLVTSKLGEATVTFTDNLGNANVVSNNQNGTNRFAMDLGVIHRPDPHWNFGATLYNIAQPDTDIFPRHLNVGAAYRPTDRRWVAALDFSGIGSNHTDVNFGGEYNLGKSFAVRAGVYRGRPTLGAGFGTIFNVVYSPDNSLIGASIAF